MSGYSQTGDLVEFCESDLMNGTRETGQTINVLDDGEEHGDFTCAPAAEHPNTL